MKKLLSLLLVLSLTMVPAMGSILQEISEIQKQASNTSQKALQDGGAEGLKWQLLRKKGNILKVDITSFDKPSLLLVSANRTQSNIRVNYYGVKDGKLLARNRTNTGDHLIIKSRDKDTSCEAIQIEGGPKDMYVWLGEEDVIPQIWKKYLSKDYAVYNDHWLPLLKKNGVTGAKYFYEIQAMKGIAFPDNPRDMAAVYASNCSDRISDKVTKAAKRVKSWEDAEAIRSMYHQDRILSDIKGKIEAIDPGNVFQALVDMDQKYPERKLMIKYGSLAKDLAKRKVAALKDIDNASKGARKTGETLLEDHRELMLANPLLDNMELVAVSRGVGFLNIADHSMKVDYPGRKSQGGNRNSEGSVLGAPTLSTHSILKNIVESNEWNSQLVKLSNLRGDVKTTPLYTAPGDELLISNARPHWDGSRIAFTMGSHLEPMGLFELDVASGKTRRLSPDTKDHFVDSCYLPDGNVVVMSTAIMTALPCEGGSHLLANMYLLNPDTGKLRQLGIDQENSYHATVQEDGRVMFVRYEYADTPHYVTRVLMNMNPDGSNQRSIYGSNSVWPTALFYPQQVPNHPNLFSGVVAGHHGPSHMGRLVLFDTSKGREEADGAVQFIGHKDEPVEAVMVDRLYATDFPKHMYSVPLDPEYYLSVMKPAELEPWGLYLVDSFDNTTLIHQPEDEFLAWPQVMTKKEMPPVIPSRIREESETSTLYVQDIYEGPGLNGIPRGTVKELAIFAFHYGYKGAASHRYIGIESGWDARYLLGTVPVNEDGSAMFTVPSMLPITLMPLDEDGMAVQKMRSWINPQPGEVLSCVGCHESADTAPINKPTMAFTQRPAEIKPWYGEQRPYAFVTEVQPVLDKFCISCHDGTDTVDLRNSFSEEQMLNDKKYSDSYVTLQKYVRRNGPESDYQMLVPMEWHATSSKLIQMLKKGHHGVALDDEAWRRFYMWIDLNVPFHAAFHPEDYGGFGDQVKWRAEGLKEYANLDWNPEDEYKELVKQIKKPDAVKPVETDLKFVSSKPALNGWPINSMRAEMLQRESGGKKSLVVEFGEPGRSIKSYDNSRAITKTLDGKERIEFVRIPAGKYVIGSENGYPNEQPRVVEIEKPFWMSTTEVSNSQLQAFDPVHDSRYADWPEKDQTSRGVPLYNEEQPAVRVSHAKAEAFCEWLSLQTGKNVKLPTEEQWEWAARAGTDSDTWYGDRKASFVAYANLSDHSHGNSSDFTRRNPPQYFLYDKEQDDRNNVTAPVKSYQPNPWGLYDMIGNAEEWTASKYDGEDGTYIVKGGSWFDLPEDARSATRWGYDENIRLPDLGFRIIIEEDGLPGSVNDGHLQAQNLSNN